MDVIVNVILIHKKNILSLSSLFFNNINTQLSINNLLLIIIKRVYYYKVLLVVVVLIYFQWQRRNKYSRMYIRTSLLFNSKKTEY